MAARTFLDLVNGAIYETKVVLDPLTSVNFASPPRTTMYVRFQNWINMAYKELLMKRNEYFFRKERATVSVWPRIHIAGLAGGTFVPAIGDTLVGQSSLVQLTVKNVYTFEDVETDTVNEYTIGVAPVSGYDLQNLILGELFDKTNGTPAVGSSTLKGIGQYNFATMVTNLESIDMYSVYAEKTVANAVLEGSNITTNQVKLTPVPWEDWYATVNSSNYQNWLGDMPVYISKTPQGWYELFPQPAGNILLSFDFTSKPPQMAIYSDTPALLPDQFHDYLMWRAVQEYADFDSQTKLFIRATKHVEEYLYMINRDQLPTICFAPSKFNR
jgi:hypothetical protein